MRQLTVLLGLAVALVLAPVVRAESPIAVVFPKVKEPFRGLFLDIVRGVEEEFDSEIPRYELEPGYSLERLDQWLDHQQTKVVIALGGRGYKALSELRGLVDVVFGGVDLPVSRGQLTGISLTPHPRLLFEKLSDLAPQIQRVTVVYNPEQNECLIQQAQQEAEKLGLTLNAIPAQSLLEAAGYYRSWLTELDPSRDALWLPMDSSTVDSGKHFLNLLNRAWDQSFVIFSSNVVHVQRGVLFSLFADNQGLGRSLAELAKQRVSDASLGEVGIQPLLNLKYAVNTRIAGHLGIRLSAQTLRSFDLVFPAR